MMKKMFCGLLALLLTFSFGVALASPRPEGAFRLGGGGQDLPTSAPLTLKEDRLAVAIVSHGGLGNVTYETDEAQTWLACLDASQNVLWETLVKGAASLYGLDENGDIQTICRYSQQDAKYSQYRVFSAQTGEELSQKPAVPLKISLGTDALHTTSFASFATPDYVLVQEIRDSGATGEPRLLTLRDGNGSDLWTIDQQTWQLENISEVHQMKDGILVIGNSCVLEDGSFYHPMAVKLSFEGQTLWQYRNDVLSEGDMSRVLTKRGESLIFQGFGGTGDETLPRKEAFLLELNAQTGELLREKIFSKSDTQLPGRGAFSLLPSREMAVCAYHSEQRQFDCFILNEQWNVVKSFSMEAPGTGYYRQIEPFHWQGQWWIQASSDLGNRTDAHYQKMKEP